MSFYNRKLVGGATMINNTTHFKKEIKMTNTKRTPDSYLCSAGNCSIGGSKYSVDIYSVKKDEEKKYFILKLSAVCGRTIKKAGNILVTREFYDERIEHESGYTEACRALALFGLGPLSSLDDDDNY